MSFVTDITIPHLPAVDVVIDGDGSDEVWGRAVTVNGFVTAAPAPGRVPSSLTEVSLLTDGSALYVRVRAAASGPRSIRRSFGRRDTPIDDDLVLLYLDPGATGQFAYVFGSNALGIQVDGIRTAEADEDNLAWDAHWRSAAHSGSDGWTAEFAIPWSSLRHQANVDTLGLIVVRNSPLTGETSTWPALNPQQPGWVAQEAVLGGPGPLPVAGGLELVPELTFGWTELGPDEERWTWHGFGPGATVRWSARASSVVGTVNPDFAEVESDEPQIAINRRYALYTPEKRPFFLDGLEALETRGDLVYTRSIAVPRVGLRATVEADGWTVAGLQAVDGAPQATVSEGGGWRGGRSTAIDTVVRARRDLGRGGFVGVLATDEELVEAGRGNRVGAVDGRLPLGEHQALGALVAVSQTDGLDGDPLGTDAELSWSSGSPRFTAELAGTWISPTFRAENGYVPRADWLGVSGELSVRRYPSGLLRKIRLTPAQGEAGWTSAGRLRAYDWEPELSVHLGDRSFAWGLVAVEGDLFERVFLAWQQPKAGFGTQLGRWLLLAGAASIGTGPYYDDLAPLVADRQAADVDLTVLAGRRLAASVLVEGERMATPEKTLYQGFVARTRLEAFASRQLSARVVVDVDTFDGGRDGDVLLAWENGPGRAVYLDGKVGWNSGRIDHWQIVAKATWGISL